MLLVLLPLQGIAASLAMHCAAPEMSASASAAHCDELSALQKSPTSHQMPDGKIASDSCHGNSPCCLGAMLMPSLQIREPMAQLIKIALIAEYPFYSAALAVPERPPKSSQV